ncbi:MAG: HisS family protein [Paracoccaceae bacterium]|nr:HisS family protein [Paracoccaceae bacterium]
MAKQKKTPRPKAETPKGFRDYFGADVERRQEMLADIAEVYRLWGFDPLESAAVETVEALGKFLPDVDRPNEGVFAWQEDGDGDWLALRYDLTAPLARVFAQHRNDLPTPYRRFAMGTVWRNEKPGPGRFRQFYQCDADTVGTASAAADAEMCMMLADALEAVGIDRGEYVIRVNNRKVLNGVLEVAGIAEDDERTRGIVLRAIDKLDRLGPDGVRALLGEGRKDESGDFTEGAGLAVNQIDTIMQFADAPANLERKLVSRSTSPGERGAEALSALRALRGKPSRTELDPETKTVDPLLDEKRLNGAWIDYFDGLLGIDNSFRAGLDELIDIVWYSQKQFYSADRIIIDPTVVRGLGYYTGPVFEAELIGEGLARFGSVAGGGRYDDLVKRFTGQPVPATGVSIGVDRLLAALEAKGRFDGQAEGPVVVTVMDRDRMADYQAMAAELRAAGIRAEVYLGNPKNFGNQLKYADKRGAPVAVIQGEDERARGVVQVKDLVLGAKIAETASQAEWADRPQQVEVPREGLLAEVRRILGQ